MSEVVILFYASGAGGTVNTAIPLDFVTHDSYWVVGHFHLILMGTISLTFTGMVYYLFPLITGRMYNVGLGKLHFVLAFTGIILVFGIQHLLGLYGMPRRVSDYLPIYQLVVMNQIATIGAWMVGSSYVIFAYNLIKSAMYGKPVDTKDPFELRTGKEYYYDFAHETHITRTSPRRMAKGLLIVFIPIVITIYFTITLWHFTASFPPPVSTPKPVSVAGPGGPAVQTAAKPKKL